MAGNPDVLALLEEMLDSGRTPEEVCRDCPELLPEVRRRWRAFRLVDGSLAALFPDPETPPCADAILAVPRPAELPQVPGYRVDALLGRGGMGVVYRAWHLRLNRAVALKMLLAGPCARPEELGRFQREAEAVAALNHPNIVQVHDVGDLEDLPYFTMELVEGGNLAEQIQGVPQPAGQAAALVATLAEAIQAAHQSGIVHRDLKPANILLTKDGTPKVTDFGLARRLEGNGGLTLSGAPLGTPSYMAPEQARGDKGAIGPATDVYALGAILYELLTGRPPFRADSPTATLHQVMADEPVPPVRLNPARAAQPGDDLPEMSAQGAAGPLRDRRRPGCRPGPLPPSRADPGSPRRPRRATGALGPAAPRPRHVDRRTGGDGAGRLRDHRMAVAHGGKRPRRAENARRAADHMATRLVLDRAIALCERGDIGPGLLWFAPGWNRPNGPGTPTWFRPCGLTWPPGPSVSWSLESARPVAHP